MSKRAMFWSAIMILGYGAMVRWVIQSDMWGVHQAIVSLTLILSAIDGVIGHLESGAR